MKEAKRVFVIIGLIGLWVFLFHSIDLAVAKDPDYPVKPINFYIPFGAGGTTDLTCRAFIEAAGKILGQPFVPINKPGAGGTLTAMAVMTAKPDGYTLGAVATSMVFVAPFSEECPYRDLTGFTLIMNFGNYVWPLIVKADTPWKTWKEFVEWARKNPRAAKIGIVGAKTVAAQGFSLWQIEKKENVEFTFIPLKSSAEILTATLGGHITLYSSTADATIVPYIEEGKLRILAYHSSMGKIPGYEKFPSLEEQYGLLEPNVLGVFGPKGLPDNVLVRLDDAFVKAVKDPGFISVMNRMYTSIVYMNRAEFNKYIENIYPKFGEKYKLLRAEEAKEKK